MKEKFRNRKPNSAISINLGDRGYWEADKEEVIQAIVRVCESYKKDGYTLTLRQLYYQLVSKDYIPNHDKVYKKLSNLKDEVVYTGMVDWTVFEDRGRVPSTPYFEHSVESALKRTADWYTLDRQLNQTNHVEVWTEKDAISSILKRVTEPMGITLVVNKGYTSSTAIYGAYDRFAELILEGRCVTILYFGDHDPSGIDMIRDINDRIIYMLTRGDKLIDMVTTWWEEEGCTYYDIARLEGYEELPELFATEDENEKVFDMFERGQIALYLNWTKAFKVKAIGLTMEQIELYNPPPNPAKITDPRAKAYVQKFGQVSWEVDAIAPKVMEQIVKDEINSSIDLEIYAETLKQEAEDKKRILKLIDNGTRK